ncbi:hypothetical protein HOY80DRAFT_957217, partial [Tuber brumale]
MTAPSDGRRPICSSVYASVGCPVDTSTLPVADQKWKAPVVDLVAVGIHAFWLGTITVAGYAPGRHNIEETAKDAFSSNDECALINRDLDEDGGDNRFSYHGRGGSVTSYDTSSDAHPDNPIPWGGEGSAYNGIGGHGPVATGENRRTPPEPSMPIAPDE